MVQQQLQNPVIGGTTNVAYVADGGPNGQDAGFVMRVDTKTGNREYLSGPKRGTGPSLSVVLDLVVDGAYVYSMGLNFEGTGPITTKICKIDRVTGDRELWLETSEIIGQSIIDDGTDFFINGLDENFVYSVHSINKATKAITGPRGTHPTAQALGMAYDSGSGDYWVSGNVAPGSVWEFDPSVNSFVNVSGGTGPELDQPYNIDFFGGDIYIANENDNNLIVLDPATGNKTLLPFSTGVVAIQRPVGIAVRDAEVLYFTTPYPGSPFFHEHYYAGANAGLTIIRSGAGQGTGPDFVRPFNIKLSQVLPGQRY